MTDHAVESDRREAARLLIAKLPVYNCDCLPDDARTGQMADDEAAKTDHAIYCERQVLLLDDVLDALLEVGEPCERIAALEEAQRAIVAACGMCDGAGFVVMTATVDGHQCDGTDEMCQNVCPVPIPHEVQEQCEYCGRPVGAIQVLIDEASGSEVSTGYTTEAKNQAFLEVGEPAQTPRPRADSAWQPIATAPKDEIAFFWVVPKSAAESYHDTSGNPIVTGGAGRRFFGKNRTWSALEKAVAWWPLPEFLAIRPRATGEAGEGIPDHICGGCYHPFDKCSYCG